MLSRRTRIVLAVLVVTALTAYGADTPFTDRPHGEALAGRGNQLWVYPIDKPRNWDAWDIEDDYVKKGIELNRPESIKVIEDSPVRAAIRVVRRFRASTVTQTAPRVSSPRILR